MYENSGKFALSTGLEPVALSSLPAELAPPDRLERSIFSSGSYCFIRLSYGGKAGAAEAHALSN